jgi:hypothetical protein
MVRKIVCNSIAVAVSILGLLTALVMAEPSRRPHPVPQAAGEPPAAAVHHDTAFHAVPDSKLEMRVVSYDGSVNGTLTVELRNRTQATEKFTSSGLYFVPEGNPDTAPQRLGAVGPMRLTGATEKEQKELAIAPGATVQVALDVYCIDSHRSSPSSANAFDVAASRLPKELSTKIDLDADAEVASKRAAGAPAPRYEAKGAIQSKVWQSRDAKWVPLSGEGKQEASKR